MGMTPPIEVANLGMWDSLILMVMALVVFGPRRLPEIGRQIGKLMYEVRKASNDFKFQMEEELRSSEDAERRRKDEERQRALAAPAQTAGTIEAVSQFPEAGSGMPGTIESPYPNEVVYPPVIAAAPKLRLKRHIRAFCRPRQASRWRRRGQAARRRRLRPVPRQQKRPAQR